MICIIFKTTSMGFGCGKSPYMVNYLPTLWMLIFIFVLCLSHYLFHLAAHLLPWQLLTLC